MTTKNLTKTEMATVTPRLAVSRHVANQWNDIAEQLGRLIASVTAARPAAGSYRDAAAWDRDRAAIDRRLDILVQLERRFSSEAARMAEAT
jgi:hypothetical protein